MRANLLYAFYRSYLYKLEKTQAFLSLKVYFYKAKEF